MAIVAPRDYNEMTESLDTLDRIEIYNQSENVNEYIEYGDLKTQITSGLLSGSTDQIAKAWVNFNGTGTVAIRDSYNVSSITDLGTGDYQINFENAMSDTNYCATFGTEAVGTSSSSQFGAAVSGIKTVNSYQVRNWQSGVLTDKLENMVSIFGS